MTLRKPPAKPQRTTKTAMVVAPWPYDAAARVIVQPYSTPVNAAKNAASRLLWCRPHVCMAGCMVSLRLGLMAADFEVVGGRVVT